MKLSKSQTRYITALHELSQGCEKGVRITDIAAKLSLTKSSVSLSMKRLEDKGLVRKSHERLVYLTLLGEQQAVQLMNKHEVIKSFLEEILGVNQEMAKQDASAIENVISLESLCAICRYTRRLQAKDGVEKACPMQHESSGLCQIEIH